MTIQMIRFFVLLFCIKILPSTIDKVPGFDRVIRSLPAYILKQKPVLVHATSQAPGPSDNDHNCNVCDQWYLGVQLDSTSKTTIFPSIVVAFILLCFKVTSSNPIHSNCHQTWYHIHTPHTPHNLVKTFCSDCFITNTLLHLPLHYIHP